jgi:hypothetical protein
MRTGRCVELRYGCVECSKVDRRCGVGDGSGGLGRHEAREAHARARDVFGGKKSDLPHAEYLHSTTQHETVIVRQQKWIFVCIVCVCVCYTDRNVGVCAHMRMLAYVCVRAEAVMRLAT